MIRSWFEACNWRGDGRAVIRKLRAETSSYRVFIGHNSGNESLLRMRVDFEGFCIVRSGNFTKTRYVWLSRSVFLQVVSYDQIILRSERRGEKWIFFTFSMLLQWISTRFFTEKAFPILRFHLQLYSVSRSVAKSFKANTAIFRGADKRK